MGSKKSIVIAFAVLCAAVVSGWLVTRYYFSQAEKAESPLIELKDETSKGLEALTGGVEAGIPVKIFHPSEDGMAGEERMFQNKPLPVEMAETILAEYLKLLGEGFKDAKLLGVYRDRNNVLYIDVSEEFRKGFAGDARQEYYLLRSLFDTTVKNIQGIEDVRLLIEGKEIESIGGHFRIMYGLKTIVQ
ncbi:MAG: hypothetical protein A2X55_11645 [Nitrospirae bacterium GWB2_47_37]|nr:MAG: hypothetical protein A2X55_11645 [Nitrospirae bacterium GWB2_47_37]HAK88874.1 hypothetical protein [Nitrospiraceae bacterium]